MSVYQDNVARFATTREQRQTETLNEVSNKFDEACKRAARLFRDGKPGRARYELARAGQQCSRIAGEGTPHIDPACPCGGERCPR